MAWETALGYREVMDRARPTPSAAILPAALLPATLVSEDAKAKGAGIEWLEKSVPPVKASSGKKRNMTEPG